VGRGAYDVVAIFLQHGACIDVKCPSTGITSLMLAVMGDDVKMIEILLAAKADINARGKDGDSALLAAAYSENIEIVRLLVRSGADVSAVDENGWNLLHKAVVSGDVKMVKEVIGLSPELRMVKDQEGMTPLDLAIRDGFKSAIKLLKSL
jgi:ankyrin repeat protein